MTCSFQLATIWSGHTSIRPCIHGSLTQPQKRCLTPTGRRGSLRCRAQSRPIHRPVQYQRPRRKVRRIRRRIYSHFRRRHQRMRRLILLQLPYLQITLRPVSPTTSRRRSRSSSEMKVRFWRPTRPIIKGRRLIQPAVTSLPTTQATINSS